MTRSEERDQMRKLRKERRESGIRQFHALGLHTGHVQTVRPLRIAERARRLAETSQDAESLRECAAEIERLYRLLNDSLKLGKKALDLAGGKQAA